MPEEPTRSWRRRTVLTAAAWTTPVIATATPAPAFAVSPCAPVDFPANWVANNVQGSLSGSGNGYSTGYAAGGVNVYVSSQDNSSTASSASTGNDAVITLTRPLTLVVGRPYTFTWTVASQFGSNTPSNSQQQLLDITIGGTAVRRYATQTSGSGDPVKASRATGYTALATSTAGITTQTVTATYTPTTANVNLVYRFTLPARGYAVLIVLPTATYTSGSDDIAISAPTITGC